LPGCGFDFLQVVISILCFTILFTTPKSYSEEKMTIHIFDLGFLIPRLSR